MHVEGAGIACWEDARWLSLAGLVPTSRRPFEAGLANSIRKAYRTGTERYMAFCGRTGRQPFPAREKNCNPVYYSTACGWFGPRDYENLLGSGEICLEQEDAGFQLPLRFWPSYGRSGIGVRCINAVGGMLPLFLWISTVVWGDCSTGGGAV